MRVAFAPLPSPMIVVLDVRSQHTVHGFSIPKIEMLIQQRHHADGSAKQMEMLLVSQINKTGRKNAKWTVIAQAKANEALQKAINAIYGRMYTSDAIQIT